MKKKNNLQAYAFLTPFLILVTLLYILPAVLTVVMAFTGLDKTFVWKFVGMKNFPPCLYGPEYADHRAEHADLCRRVYFCDTGDRPVLRDHDDVLHQVRAFGEPSSKAF